MKNTRFTLYVVAAGALAFALVGCGGSKSNQPSSENTAAPAAGAPTSGGKTVDSATAGEIMGTVTLDGTPPKMRAINMTQEAVCVKQHPTPVLSQEVVTGDKGSLANVVVYVKSGLEGYTFPAPTDSVKIEQKGCMYNPHVLALQPGQTLEVINSDPTAHNIHPVPKDNREWNESQPPNAPPIDKSFAREEIAIPVKCNVHPWMKAYIAVAPNPYFQVTGQDGTFDLKNLPPGTYDLVAWHELYGPSEQMVTIGPKESKTVTFTFKANAPAAPAAAGD